MKKIGRTLEACVSCERIWKNFEILGVFFLKIFKEFWVALLSHFWNKWKDFGYVSGLIWKNLEDLWNFCLFEKKIENLGDSWCCVFKIIWKNLHAHCCFHLKKKVLRTLMSLFLAVFCFRTILKKMKRILVALVPPFWRFEKNMWGSWCFIF